MNRFDWSDPFLLDEQLSDDERMVRDTARSYAQDRLAPRVIEAFANENYAESVRLMEPVFPQLVRVGGSHAQREVFEDTMLEAYIRAEQFEKAEDMLRGRLKQRESVRDNFWMGRVQSAQGQTTMARSSFNEATKGWEAADSSAPEIVALNNLMGV